MEIKNYSKRDLNELEKELRRLEGEYESIEEQCAKEGKTYREFCDAAYDVKEKIFMISKHIRLKQTPEVDYGKEWRGDIIDLEEFKRMCLSGYFTDSDGMGYYATENAKSNITIIPSDIKENLYRKDFTHVIWFGN